ncbi:hypothetical protein [Marinobacterium maritimum]|uniref:hypothetical protein n=1 Tax=Marinobacterium maritimum TaxID=500162 RepID=UPI0031DCE4EC
MMNLTYLNLFSLVHLRDCGQAHNLKTSSATSVAMTDRRHTLFRTLIKGNAATEAWQSKTGHTGNKQERSAERNDSPTEQMMTGKRSANDQVQR